MPIDILPVSFPVNINRYGSINPDDMTATLRGLHGGFTNADLYARYSSIATEAGRQPGSQNQFGRVLRHLGHMSWRTGSTRGWYFTAS